MRHWFRAIRAALRRRAALASAMSASEPARPAADRFERGELIGQFFIGRDGEMKALPLPEARDDRFAPRPPLLPRSTDDRSRGW